MATPTKPRKLTKIEREWIKGYKHLTTFEAMHIDEVKAGEMGFEELVSANTRWFEDWASDALLAIGRMPTDDSE